MRHVVILTGHNCIGMQTLLQGTRTSERFWSLCVWIFYWRPNVRLDLFNHVARLEILQLLLRTTLGDATYISNNTTIAANIKIIKYRRNSAYNQNYWKELCQTWERKNKKCLNVLSSLPKPTRIFLSHTSLITVTVETKRMSEEKWYMLFNLLTCKCLNTSIKRIDT